MSTASLRHRSGVRYARRNRRVKFHLYRAAAHVGWLAAALGWGIAAALFAS